MEAQDTKGDTPLMLAMQEQHTRSSAWLREQEVKLEVERDALYRNAPKPPLHERYPVGSKMRIEVVVEQWQVGNPQDLMVYNGQYNMWVNTEDLKIIED